MLWVELMGEALDHLKRVGRSSSERSRSLKGKHGLAHCLFGEKT
jgi:hypothetical protein